MLKSSIPFVSRVENRRPARGGVDGEDIENAKVRGPIRLRTRGRAVTTEDYEQLAREAAPEVARVRAVAAGDGTDAGSVRVLVVPSAVSEAGRLRFDQLVPSPDTLQKITDRLEESRVIGTRAIVEPPVYRGITVVAKLRARLADQPDPAPGGGARGAVRVLPPDHRRAGRHGLAVRTPDQRGRDLLGAPGDPRHRARRGRAAVRRRPVTGQRGQQTQRLELETHALVFSYEHQVLVEGA